VARAGLQTTLTALQVQGIRLGVITNGEVPFQTPKIEQLSINHYLSTVVISEAVQMHKPDPRIFAHALAAIDCRASEAWFIGDHPVNDVLGAAAAGLRAIWLAGVRPWPIDHPEAQWQITALEEIVELASSEDQQRPIRGRGTHHLMC
jgi:putative hydrolase of the HAD superfamily